MIAAAPAADQEQTIQKKPRPAVLWRGPEAGFHRIHYDFPGSGVNHIESCLFQKKYVLYQFHTP